ncbi:MAG TPA: histidine kinase [Bryobacteraceae bacterium]|jgi:sensor histidine kinase YesM|nr:histidine kinase [Bryobacteraceae bacterium]
MHPILASRRRLALYLAAWIPVLGLLVYVSAAGGGAPMDAVAVFGPACVAFAFVCLSPWQICRIRPLRLSQLPELLVTFVAAGAAGSLVLVGTAAAMAYALSRPAVLGAGLTGLLFGMGVLLYLFSTGLHYAMLAAEVSREAERNAAEARTLAREAELQSLRNQLNPHFLFNSLHSISALATLDGARAREMCIRLADFLRSSLGMGQRESIPLREELALARSYLEVEQVRFGERLRVEEEIGPACEDCAVPPLLLQPLVENAVKHGIAALVEGGSIRLAASRSGGNVSITLENGFDPETPAGANLGLGLAHVRRRLQVRYGEDALFDAGPHDGVYRVTLRFPCESPMASSSRA